MTIDTWTPRELEDFVVACPSCGAYSPDAVYGDGDWVLAPDEVHEQEVTDLVWRARGEDPGDVDGDDNDDGEDERPWTIDASRVEVVDYAPTCSGCGEDLPVSWQALAARHEQLSADERRWLQGYVRMKERIRFALDHAHVALRGDLGTFVNVHFAGATVGEFQVRAGASPLFLPSQKLVDLVDKRALGPKQMLRKLASEESCVVDGEPLQLPSQYDGPKLTIDDDLGSGLQDIAAALKQHGVTPLRGLGTLRVVDYEWDGDRGRLIYLDFVARIRERLEDRFR